MKSVSWALSRLRPYKPPQCNNLFSFSALKTLLMPTAACRSFPSVSMSRAFLSLLAGFQMITIGRSWVTAEATMIGDSVMHRGLVLYLRMRRF